MKKDISLDYDKIYESKAYGKYKIIKDLGLINGKSMVEIQFIDSGTTRQVLRYMALQGRVKDTQYGYNPNKTFYSRNYGPFKMIKYLGVINNHGRVLIQFLNTGSVVNVQIRNAIDGKVSDPTIEYNKKTVINDMIKSDNYDNYINSLIKTSYEKIYNRCYNSSCQSYKFYGAIGVLMSNEWKSDINIFMNDVKHLNGFDKFYNKPQLYHLDKDYLQQNIPVSQRIYSKETCIWLYYMDNLNLTRIENKPNTLNQYFGVSINSAGNYNVNRVINGQYHHIGTFTNEIAAANAHNYFENYYHNYELVPLLNDVPIMSYNEFMSYKIPPLKPLYHLIDK